MCSNENQVSLAGSRVMSALVALLVGTLVYVVDRDWNTALFLAPVAHWQLQPSSWFSGLGNVLPSFLHAYAISVLLVVVSRHWRGSAPWVCAGWFVVAAALECLQADVVTAGLFDGLRFSTNNLFFLALQDYAMLGRFDTNDLMATALGCVAAFAATTRLGRSSCQQT
jgi:hypothetical protein